MLIRSHKEFIEQLTARHAEELETREALHNTEMEGKTQEEEAKTAKVCIWVLLCYCYYIMYYYLFCQWNNFVYRLNKKVTNSEKKPKLSNNN